MYGIVLTLYEYRTMTIVLSI